MKRRRNGEGSFFKNKKGLWTYTCRYTDPMTGNPCRKVITARTQEKLDGKVSAWKDARVDGLAPFSNMTVQEWCKKFLEDIKLSVKAKTFSNYSGNINNHIIPGIGKIKLQKLTAGHIQPWLNTLSEKLSPISVSTVRRILCIVLNLAVRYRIIAYNPAKATKTPRIVKRLPVVLDKEQIVRLLATAQECKFLSETSDESSLFLRRCYFSAVCLALDSGLRKGELFALQWGDIKNGKLYVTKAIEGIQVIGTPKTDSSNRVVTLSNGVIRMLEEWYEYQQKYCNKWKFWELSNEALIFPNSYGKLISYTNLQKRWWGPLLKASEMPVNFRWHGLRATMTTQLLQAGLPVKVVSERLGHSSVSITLSKYAGLLRGIEEQAASIMDRVVVIPSTNNNTLQ